MKQCEVLPQDNFAANTFTLTEIARQCSLAESTARYYCKRFHMFMPVVGHGRRRRYEAVAIDVMRAIIEQMTVLRSASAVEEVLAQRFPRVVDAPTAPTVPSAGISQVPTGEGEGIPALALRLVEQQTQALQGIAISLQHIAQQQESLRQMTETTHTLMAENTELKQEITRIKDLLRASDNVHQEDLEQIRTWVGRALRNKTQE